MTNTVSVVLGLLAALVLYILASRYVPRLVRHLPAVLLAADAEEVRARNSKEEIARAIPQKRVRWIMAWSIVIPLSFALTGILLSSVPLIAGGVLLAAVGAASVLVIWLLFRHRLEEDGFRM